MQIAKDTIVRIHYRLTDKEGEVLDSSEEGDPLAYLHGHSQIVPGLESALEGQSEGSHVDATVEPAEGYGEYDERLNLRLPLEAFPEDVRPKLHAGVQFMAPHPEQEKEPVLFTVVSETSDSVTVTGNHPLAGQTLVFSVDVVSVREATGEELEHGHAHGEGGHGH